MSTPRIICYDLDSTMFDVHHREYLAPEGPNRGEVDNWIDYSKACIDDTVIEGVAQSARLFAEAGFYIYFVSGRNIEAYQETVDTLHKWNVPWHYIRLHRADDPRHNGEYKSQFINELIASGNRVELMFEDHVSVCEMIEERTGVPCITVRPRYDDGVGVSFNLNQHPELAAQ